MGQRRVVVAMNEIVSDAGMLRLTRQYAIQNQRGFFFSRITLVVDHHPRRDKRERIEDARLIIRRIAPVKLLHSVTVSERPRFVVKLVGVFVKNFYSRDVISLTLSLRAGGLCLFHRAPS